MSKPNNKKMLTVMISIAMVFSALAILSFAATPAYAASSGSITLDPTVFAVNTATITLANGGTFGSGATVYFYFQSTNTFPSSAPSSDIGSYTLAAGTTTLSNAAVTLTIPAGTAAGTYYIAASDTAPSGTGATYASAVTVTVSSATPSITLSSTNTQPTKTETVSGSGWDLGSTLALYLKYAGGTALISSFAASDLGSVTFTVPTNLPGSSGGTTYYVVAQETSSSSDNYGITAQSDFVLKPIITTSPTSISGTTSSTFTITGYGFPASDSFAASTSLNPTTTITVGGQDAINPSFSSDSTGALTATVSALNTAISSYGSAAIVLSDGTNSFTNIGTILVSVPNPTSLGFSFVVTATVGSTYNVNDSVTATVWNFPASQTVDFTIGSYSVGSLVTDSNGAGTASTLVIPAVPGATYTPVATASSSGLTTKATTGTTSYTISGSFLAVDPAGTSLTSTEAEYIASNGLITVKAYALNPSTSTYDFSDGISGAIGAGGLVTSVVVGTESSSSGQFTPAANGTLIFTYSPAFTTSSTTTGTSSTITSSNGVGEQGFANTGNYLYKAVGQVSITTPSADYTIYASGATTQNLAVSGLVPYNANLYPGNTSNYNVYIGTSQLSLSFIKSSVRTTGTSINTADSSIEFNVPSASGVYNLSITYNGQTVSNAVQVRPIVISSAGSSASSGTLNVIALSSGYEFVGYGYTDAPQLWYNSYGAVATEVSSSEALTDGAFAVVVTPSAEPAGTYAVYTMVSSGGSNYFVYSSYVVSESLSLSATSGNIGASVTATGSGLVPTTYYGLYFGGTLQSTNNGTSLDSGVAFTVPTIAAGTYTVSVKQVGSTSSVASHTYKVQANSAITLGTSSQYAFPGQLETFSVTGFSLPTGFVTNGGVLQYFAQVAFNGTIVATVPASLSSGTLSGSFVNPNNAPGSYYKLTITGYAQASILGSSGGSITSSGTTMGQEPLTGSQSDYFALVSGNGALLTGISSSQIATLEADINSTVSTSLTVPISQLNAAITSINGAVANLKTTVGNITTDLSTINATVNSISSGLVVVQTDLGSISTSLASLNASLVAFNNNVVTINTTLGQVVTSLGSIQTQVKANANGIATVSTDVGTIQGQIVSQNGNITTVKTSLGTLTANVSKVQSQTSGFSTLEIFLIVIIVLVLITLVISFLAVNAANKAARRATEEKKQ